MARFYSKSTGGFYSDSIHAEFPPDAVEVSDVEHANLMSAQAQGKVIGVAANGQPIALDQPPPTLERVKALLSAAVSKYVDAAAMALGYDNILSAISYADDATVPAYQAQGQALRAWRANVWKDATSALNAITSASAAPTAAALVATLPVFVAPTAAA